MNACPTPDRLATLLSDSTPNPSESAALEAHVDQCPHCQKILDNLSSNATTHRLRRLQADWQQAELDRAPDRIAIQRIDRPQPPATPNFDAPAAQLPAVPGYELIHELGHGGMGIVYLARQTRLNRPVALKMILATQPGDEMQRFRKEAETLAALRHPNIVQVFDVGECQGRPYLTMEYVAGETLAEAVRAKPQPAPVAARLVQTLAQAAHYGHEHGFVHRDLKPANILLTFPGDAPPDPDGSAPTARLDHAVPKIADFGLVKRLGEISGGTQAGQMIGTPSYMAPEQADSRAPGVGPTTDVYALGGILYELVTGRPPFQGESPLETVVQVLHEDPVSPSRLRPNLPRDLVTICMKCLHKDAHKRYASAQELADDLGRYLAREPIHARPTAAWERAVKWARRRPAVASLSAGIVFVTLVGAALVLAQWRSAVASAHAEKAAQRVAASARAEAETRARAEAEARTRAEKHLIGSYLDQGISLCEKGSVGTGLVWMAQGLQLASNLGDADLEHAIRMNIATWRHRLVRVRHPLPNIDWIAAVAFTPDGQLAITGNRDKTARVFHAATGLPARNDRGNELTLPHDHPVWALAVSQDGKVLVTGSGDDDPFYSDLADWKVAIHTAGRRFRNGPPSTGDARIWDLQTGQPIGPPLPHPGSVVDVQISADARTLLTVGGGEARLWPMPQPAPAPGDTAAPDFVAIPHAGGVLTAALHPADNRVVTGGHDGWVRFWDATTGQPTGTPRRLAGPVTIVQFAPHTHVLLTASVQYEPPGENVTGWEVRLWNSAATEPLSPPLPHGGPVRSAAFSGDGELLVTGGARITSGSEPWRGEARVWSGSDGTPLGPSLDHPDVVTAVAISISQRLFATGSRDSFVRVWETANSQLLARPNHDRKFHHGFVSSVVFSPDSKSLLGGNLSDRACAKIFDVPLGHALAPPLVHHQPVRIATFSPDGNSILTSGDDSVLQLWDARSGHCRVRSRAPSGVVAVAFHPNGEWLATGARDGIVRIWDTPTLQSQGELCRHPGEIDRITFDSTARHLITSGFGRMQIWNATSGEPIRDVPHQPLKTCAIFSPDGSSILEGFISGVVQRTVTANGRSLGEWTLPVMINQMAIDRTDRLLATTDYSPAAQLWALSDGTPYGPPLVHSELLTSLSFSPDGRSLLTSSIDRSARLWDVATGRPLGPPLLHGYHVLHAAFNANGKTIVTAGADGLALRWIVDDPIPGTPEHISLWIETLSGMYFDAQGIVRPLSPEAWQQRRSALEHRARPPATR